MEDLPAPQAPPRLAGRGNRLIASARFRRFCARLPGLRWLMRREGAALFDLMQGFVQSQMLLALVELRVLHRLADGPATVPALAKLLSLPPERLAVLLQAGAAMGLLKRRGAQFALARRGAALLSLPGLAEMVRHHGVLYRDLTDPVAFIKGESEPALARFWPYVFGAEGPIDAPTTLRYSRLMAESQQLVAEEALLQVSFRGVRRLMDIGGGTGTFLRAVRARYPSIELALFDLPEVVAQAALPADVTRHGGSFRDGHLPRGADAISLVRVLYDHSDDTVRALLASVHDALPEGGRLYVIEPISGGERPDPQVDLYFSVYTMAMQTGRTRSGEEISAMLRQAGFGNIQTNKGNMPFVTGSITARKPGAASFAPKTVNTN